ncbi:MAG: hypothetical protein J1E01_08510, partial [Acetatifactor sp.]|nr:hypothetical protein [Acetatifactor sp.]
LPRNPSFYAYYQKQLARGKSKTQALILISRRLVNIIYGMLKKDGVSDAKIKKDMKNIIIYIVCIKTDFVNGENMIK